MLLMISSVVICQPNISIGKVTTTGVPPLVKVPVNVSAPLNNVKSFILQFSYDKSSVAFNHKAASARSGVSNFALSDETNLSVTESNGLISLSWVNSTGATLDGKLFDLDFNYSLGFSEVRFVSATIKDMQGKKLTFNLVNGSISTNTDAAIKVIYPNGGETLEVVGSSTTITWTSIYMSNVNLEYTTDNGTSWQTIVSNYDATKNNYAWTIPNTISSALCKIKITDVLPAATSDESNAVFTINSTPVLTLTTPNGGEELKVGGVKTIKWDFKNVLNIKLEYTANASAPVPIWQSIVATLPSKNSSYDWIIPNSVSTDCKVRVVDLANAATVLDLSDALLSIKNAPINVNIANVVEATINRIGKVCTKVPFPDKYWFWADSTHAWDSENAHQVIDEDGFHEDFYAVDTLIITGKVPVDVGWLTSLQYLEMRITFDPNILILDSVIPAIAEFKNFSYSVENGVIHVIWGTSSPVDIHGKIFDLKFSYKKFTKPLQWIQSGWDYDGPPVLNPSTPTATIDPRNFSDIKINMVSAKNSMNDSISASNWTHGSLAISNSPAVKILAPIPGDSLEVNDVNYSVLWSSRLITNLSLKYSTNNGSDWNEIVNSTLASSGTFTWPLPNVNSANCLIKIANIDDGAVFDVSASPFVITNLQKINLIAPDGGEILKSGTTKSITWSSRNISNVKLEYSTNIDTTWTEIKPSHPAKDYKYDWIVPNLNSELCKVRVSNVLDPLKYDQSAAVFTINNSKIKIKIPHLVSPAGDIVVPLNSEQVHGATYFNFSIKYNSATMVLDTVIRNTVISSGQFNYVKDNGVVRIVWFSTTPVNFVGDLFNMKFKSYSGVYSVFQFDSPNQIKDSFNKLMDIELVNGSIGITDIEDELIPTQYALSQNYPNPFNPSTTIQYQIPRESHVTLTIYNVIGQRIVTLVDEVKQAGFYNVRWNASNCANGIYFYSIVAKDFIQTRKMILLK